MCLSKIASRDLDSSSWKKQSTNVKDKQYKRKITQPRMGKNTSWRATPYLSIVHYYVGAFTTIKSYNNSNPMQLILIQ